MRDFFKALLAALAHGLTFEVEEPAPARVLVCRSCGNIERGCAGRCCGEGFYRVPEATALRLAGVR
jgi:hypothetical protein